MGGPAMAAEIPLTNFAKYMRVAEKIQQDLGECPESPAALRQAVVDLVKLARQSLEEAAQVFEALALVVLAHHPDVRRGSQ